MSKYIDRAIELRADTSFHCNCAQAVIIPFLENSIPKDELLKVFSNYGRGMRIKGLCGAVSGGVTVLGYFGINDDEILNEFYERAKEALGGYLDCKDLLPLNPDNSKGNRPYCNTLIFKTIEIVEDMLQRYMK